MHDIQQAVYAAVPGRHSDPDPKPDQPPAKRKTPDANFCNQSVREVLNVFGGKTFLTRTAHGSSKSKAVHVFLIQTPIFN
jgi:hypothetical protein